MSSAAKMGRRSISMSIIHTSSLPLFQFREKLGYIFGSDDLLIIRKLFQIFLQLV